MLQVVSDKTRCGVFVKGTFFPIERRPEIGDCWATLGALSPNHRFVEIYANQGGGAAMEVVYAVRVMDLYKGQFVDFKSLKTSELSLHDKTVRIDANMYSPRSWSRTRSFLLVGSVFINLEGKSVQAFKAGNQAVFLR